MHERGVIGRSCSKSLILKEAIDVGALQRLLFRAVVVLGEIQRSSGALFEPVGRVLSWQQDKP